MCAKDETHSVQQSEHVKSVYQMCRFCVQTHIVQQIEAVQALAAMDAALDATQRRFTLVHRQRQGGWRSNSTSSTRSTRRPVWIPGGCGRCISIRWHPAKKYILTCIRAVHGQKNTQLFSNPRFIPFIIASYAQQVHQKKVWSSFYISRTQETQFPHPVVRELIECASN